MATRPHVIVVDPPRAGLSKKVVHRIVDAAPKRIVYVSCNPTTLAPNAAELVDAGWVLRKVRPVDMFPQTHHIECVWRRESETLRFLVKMAPLGVTAAPMVGAATDVDDARRCFQSLELRFRCKRLRQRLSKGDVRVRQSIRAKEW